MSTEKKVINFLSETTDNYGMSENQYRLFDQATDGLAWYRQNEDPNITREEYFENEVGNGWSDEQVKEFAKAFNL